MAALYVLCYRDLCVGARSLVPLGPFSTLHKDTALECVFSQSANSHSPSRCG